MRHLRRVIRNHPKGFNPRICKRCDSSFRSILCILLCFNPRICKRCDSSMIAAPTCKPRFNPRICKRCDSCCALLYHQQASFNPRICKRCDSKRHVKSRHRIVSIHASVKDATLCLKLFRCQNRFQSTHL